MSLVEENDIIVSSASWTDTLGTHFMTVVGRVIKVDEESIFTSWGTRLPLARVGKQRSLVLLREGSGYMTWSMERAAEAERACVEVLHGQALLRIVTCLDVAHVVSVPLRRLKHADGREDTVYAIRALGTVRVLPFSEVTRSDEHPVQLIVDSDARSRTAPVVLDDQRLILE